MRSRLRDRARYIGSCKEKCNSLPKTNLVDPQPATLNQQLYGSPSEDSLEKHLAKKRQVEFQPIWIISSGIGMNIKRSVFFSPNQKIGFGSCIWRLGRDEPNPKFGRFHQHWWLIWVLGWFHPYLTELKVNHLGHLKSLQAGPWHLPWNWPHPMWVSTSVLLVFKLVGILLVLPKIKTTTPLCSNPFCKWFWSGFWVPRHLLTGHLEH